MVEGSDRTVIRAREAEEAVKGEITADRIDEAVWVIGGITAALVDIGGVRALRGPLSSPPSRMLIIFFFFVPWPVERAFAFRGIEELGNHTSPLGFVVAGAQEESRDRGRIALKH